MILRVWVELTLREHAYHTGACRGRRLQPGFADLGLSWAKSTVLCGGSILMVK